MENNPIDKLTLELMCNKKQFHKVLSKTNPKKFEQRREHLSKVEKYSHEILNITKKLVGSPDYPITNDITDPFQDYVKSIIRYLEMKELENKYRGEQDNDQDDVLFGEMDDPVLAPQIHSENEEIEDTDETEETDEPDCEEAAYAIEKCHGFFWGKKIKKIGGKKTNESTPPFII